MQSAGNGFYFLLFLLVKLLAVDIAGCEDTPEVVGLDDSLG